MTHPNEKQEIIEQALQEAVGGGVGDWCAVKCRIASRDICHIDLCGSEEK
jgi:hypothetical protein